MPQPRWKRPAATPAQPDRQRTAGRRRVPTTPAQLAFAIAVLGVGFRIWLTLRDAPLTNSDEATIGLAALHIWRGEDLPVYFYGQHYMGTIEAYLAAPLVGWLGPTTLALRLPALALFALFLFLMYALTRRIYSPWLGVATVAFLALGSDRIVKNQLIAGGGYPETSPMVVALLLGVLVIARSGRSIRRVAEPGGLPEPAHAGIAEEPDRRRPWVMGGVGLLAGLILWNHLLPLPYLLAAGVLLAVRCRGEVLSRNGLPLAGGLLAGAFPLIWHDLHQPWSESSLAVFWHLQTTGTDPSASERLYGGALLGLPLGTGMCAPSYCAPWQLWWGPIYVALLVVAAVLAVRMAPSTGGAPSGRRRMAPSTGGAPSGRRRTAPSVERDMRLLLAVAALLTVASYARNSSAGDSPIESARYLSCVLISTPAWLEPIWRSAGAVARPAWQRLLAAIPLAAGAAMAVYATAALIAHVPVYTSATEDQRMVLAALASHGQTRLYADYWTCNWISYQTGEERVCAVLADDLTEGFNRYAPYWDEVGKATSAAYLAPIGSPLDQSLAAAMSHRTVETAANYHLYLPPTPPR